MSGLLDKITRKQSLENVKTHTSLQRCLSIFDLTLLGIGAMIGSGIYVMTGKVVKEHAGPGIVVSFILAACVILMVAGCFTEFAARVHRTGSTYLYVYLSFGELLAFLIGFLNVIGNILAGATSARAWSGYLDSLFNGSISNFTRSHLKELSIGPPFSPYPDFIGMGIMLFMTLIIALGAKCSSWFNSFFAAINIAILLFVIITGFVYADITNWTSEDSGGFLPYGFSGVMSGAAVCFWAFSGFEILSCAVEEAHNPKRNIPIATVVALVIVMILYVGTTASITIMTPYYKIDITSPLPSAFAAKGLNWARVIVSLGPLCGLTTTLISSIYSFARVAYKMSEDGLLFTFFSKVNECTHVPVWSVVSCGSISAMITLFMDLSELLSFGVVLILMSYCLVCGGVIILRYQPTSELTETSNASPSKETSDDNETKMTAINTSHENETHSADRQNDTDIFNEETGQEMRHVMGYHPHNDKEELLSTGDNVDDQTKNGAVKDIHVKSGQMKRTFFWLWPCNKFSPGRWSTMAVVIMSVATLLASIIPVHYKTALLHGTWWLVALLSLSVLLVLLMIATLYAHQQNIKGLPIKMPGVPVVPAFSICVCLYLLVSTATVSSWIGCGILLIIGLAIYFTYSIRHSKLNQVMHHPLPLDALEGANVGLLAEGISEKDLTDSNF